MSDHFPSTRSSPAAKAYRMFLAVKPSPDATNDIETLRATWRLTQFVSGRAVRKEHLHSTLCAMHEMDTVPDALIERMRAAAACVIASPFGVRLDRVNRAGGWVSLSARADGLRRLTTFRDAVRRSLVRADLGGLLEPRSQPHVSLLYGNQDIAPHPIVPIGWVVRDFVLIRSHVGATRHEEIDRWALQDLSGGGEPCLEGVQAAAEPLLL